MQNRNKSTPQAVAREILAQARGAEPAMQKKRADGTFVELDLSRLAGRAAARMGDCGTFPRGKVTLTWRDGGKLDLGAHQCNHRLCPRCARRRGFRLAADMAGALTMIEVWGWKNDRTRFATLTIENTDSAEEGISRVMDAWHRTLATKTWGRLIAGGFRAVEVKPGKNGKWNVHLHAILYLWVPGVPYKLLREAWDRAAGGNYNQRFDTLRNKAKPMPGESKTAAAARYLVKYLVKHEELRGTRRMPGGIVHLLGAIEGRRLFGAWGLGAAAMRIERHERPMWTAAWDRHLTGYTRNGELPVHAELVMPWGVREQVEIPLPSLPSAFRREDIPEQVEPRGKAWTVRRVRVGNPMQAHPWQALPSASIRRAGDMQTMLQRWLDNPRSRGPKPFRWRTWYEGATREWTDDAATIMGQRVGTCLGAVLWDRIQKPDERFPPVNHPEHFAAQMVRAHAAAVRHARNIVFNACDTDKRIAYLARLPEDIRHQLEELCREQEQARWTYRKPEAGEDRPRIDLSRLFPQRPKNSKRPGASQPSGLTERQLRRLVLSGERIVGRSWIHVPLPIGPWT